MLNENKSLIPRELRGYAMLAHAVVRKALTHTSVTNHINGGINPHKTNRLREINTHFAMNSKLLKHFCDIFELDYVRTKRAIINNNKERITLCSTEH